MIDCAGLHTHGNQSLYGKMLAQFQTARRFKLESFTYFLLYFYTFWVGGSVVQAWPHFAYFFIVDKLQMPTAKLKRNLESQTTVNAAVAKYFGLHHKKWTHSFFQWATTESEQWM